jgi:Protein of unknown function
MAAEINRRTLANLRSVEAGLHLHRRADAVRASGCSAADSASGFGGERAISGRRTDAGHANRQPRAWWVAIRRAVALPLRAIRNRWFRRCGIGLAAAAAVCLLAAGALWAVLANGPISLDVATPWITSAIAENFGNQFRVEIGGTVLERDEHGRAAMRLRGIVVRDRDGTVIAHAPKAEVGFSSSSLLSAHPRAERLNLVGAELAVRIEADGRVSVSTGADAHPLATASPLAAVATPGMPIGAPIGAAPSGALPVAASGAPPAAPKRDLQENFAAFLAWIDSLGALGLDGGDLTEVGLKSGNLVVDDRRNGQQSRFENIHLSLTRPSAGTLEFELGSEDVARPWQVIASMKPGAYGMHAVDVEARKIMLRDILLALRVDDGQIDADAPISATLRADIAQDGTPQFATGRMVVGPGVFTDAKDPEARIAIDRAELSLDWNAAQRVLAMPFQIVSGGTRVTLSAHVEAPREPNGVWAVSLGGGSAVLAPVEPDGAPLVLNRVLMRGRIDPVSHRFNIDQAEASGKAVSVAMSGNVDFSSSDPRLTIGMAARNLSAPAFKQMWPVFVNPEVRKWVIERTAGGTMESGEIATNAPISTLRSGGPPVPDDGLSIQIITSGTTLRPFDNLPEIRDADLVTRIKGRTATVTLGRGTVEMASGRRLTIANGVFEVPDSAIKHPPAKVRARVEGPVAAAAELLAMDRLRDTAGVPPMIDPAATRGNVLATLNLALPLNEEVKSGTITYAIAADIVNFSADHFLMSQKIEAQTLRAVANNQGYQLKGEMRVGGAPATMELRHASGEADAELRLTGTLDDAARSRFGIDPATGISGPIPIKVTGRVAFSPDQDSRLAVEADLAQARIDNLIPGWSKLANRPARATFTYVGRSKAARLDDIAYDGAGASFRGGVEFDQNGDLATANFPVFGLVDGDKASLRLERTPDNLFKVVLRGDAFDGRGFIKASMAGGGEARQQRKASTGFDFDIDAKVGAVSGFMGEVLRNIDLHLTRRAGLIRHLALNARFGSEGVLQGELRGKAGDRQIVYVESTDAGALFRFADFYSRIMGGQMWIAMDPPTPDGARQEGLLDVREFAVKGEAALDGVVAGAPNGANNGVQFSRMRVEFTRAPGKMSIREGLVTGPMVGATIDGAIDYAGNDVRMRGTFVPLYGLNSAFGQIPIVGFLLGGKEGLIGSMTYEVVGSPGAPVLHVNPISMVAPGFVRKFLEFPTTLPGERFPAPDRQ